MITNYIVYIQDSRGSRQIQCTTERDVWAALDDVGLGACYQVSSPTNLNTNQFTPY